jgi:type I restriction enzyme S subunit
VTETAEKRRRLGGREATAAQIPGAFAISVGDTGAPLPEGWKRHLLSDLARMESGHTPSRRHPEYWGGSIPWIGIRDATGNHGRTIYETNENTNALGIANSASRVLPKDTVCLSRTASVGYVVVMGREMATSQDFANWICGPDLDYRYLKYALIAEGDALLNFASGSVHQTIYFPELKSFHIAAPEKPEQSAIADILSALDDKIELNRQTNEALEGMAQAIFRDWFVDFGPTRRKAAGEADPVAIMGGLTPNPARAVQLAALFPAGFGNDGLPVGWRERPLDTIADFLNGLALQKFPAKVGEPDLPVIKIAELRNGLSERTNRSARTLPAKYIIKDGDFIFSWSGSLMAKVWTLGEGALNQHLFKVASEEFPQWFYGQWVHHHMPEFQLIAASKATTMGHIQRGHLSSATTVCPQDGAMEVMSSVMQPLWDRMIHNELENRTLAEARDYLLPRLMSGVVRVALKVEAA